MKQTPVLVSILMTAYNRQAFIAEAIESVLASTYETFELIIVDDGSRDETVLIARNYAEKDNRVKVYVNKQNLGDYPNRNKAASYASGDYIMYVDSDDTIFPFTIKYCVEAMLQFKDAGFGIYWAYKECPPFLRSSAEAVQKNFTTEPFLGMGPGGTILKRSFFNEIGKYPTLYGPANDMYFNLKAVCNTDVVLLPKKFMNYRIHEQQERNNEEAYILYNYLYLRDAFMQLPLSLSQKELRKGMHKNNRRFLVNIFKQLLLKGRVKLAVQIINKANFGISDAFTAVFN